jgi:hypothetical protein
VFVAYAPSSGDGRPIKVTWALIDHPAGDQQRADLVRPRSELSHRRTEFIPFLPRETE